jgi:predicted Zn finger-like uncharacterized protein
MIVRCDRCHFLGKVSDSKIPEKGVFAKCPKCRNRILVKKESAAPGNAANRPDWDPQISAALGERSPDEMRSRGMCGRPDRAKHCEKCGGSFTEGRGICPICGGDTGEKQFKRRINWDRGYFLFIFVLFIILLNANLRDVDTIGQSSALSVSNRSMRFSESSEDAYLPQDLKRVLIREMKARYLVRDASIREGSSDVILSLVVSPSCNGREARGLGEDFLRLYIALSHDEAKKPGDRVGDTKYNYRIGVAKAPDAYIAFGSKLSSSEGINWNR